MTAHPLHTATIATRSRSQMIEITSELQRLVSGLGVMEGMAIVYIPHTTAAVTINENADPDVQHDLLEKLSRLAPQRESYYQHSEGNSDSHLKSIAVGVSQTILIDSGRLVLGRWQGVYFCEFDGPRQRTWHAKVVAFSTSRS